MIRRMARSSRSPASNGSRYHQPRMIARGVQVAVVADLVGQHRLQHVVGQLEGDPGHGQHVAAERERVDLPLLLDPGR